MENIKQNCDQIVLILGFFDRGNVGDEAFVLPYKLLFPTKILKFSSIDDVDKVADETAIVIIAGGDVINNYFTTKIRSLLVSYKGPCYAFSVGVPYMSEAYKADIYDHVILRTKQDVEEMGSFIGHKNVSYLPDITWMLKQQLSIQKPRNETKHLTFGICLAQPYFYQNTHEGWLIDRISTFIHELVKTYENCKINLLSFNTSCYEPESDCVVNDKVYDELLGIPNVVKCTDNALRDPIGMLNFVGEHDLIIGMRYHSILFAMMQNVKFIAVYTSRKIHNLLQDYDSCEFGLELPNTHEDNYLPATFDTEELLSLLDKRLKTDLVPLDENLEQFSLMKTLVQQKVTKHVRVKTFVSSTLADVLNKCITIVKTYLNIDNDTFTDWDKGNIQTASLLKTANKDSIDLSRLICFIITNKIGSPYVWGLSENMIKPEFVITEAIKWIHEDFLSTSQAEIEKQIYYPEVGLQRRIILDVNYMCQDNYQGLHRSGWSYVIGGLQHLDGHNLGKPAQVMVDTCLERTFLWGLDLTTTSKLVPYKTPWSGFIHHTFDGNYSNYNCETLLNTKEFIDSLPNCKCLCVLSNYLAVLLKDALTAKGFDKVPVVSLCHPTEFVPDTFDMLKFLSNTERKVVNIGAWLRDPYAIYALPVSRDNMIGIAKYALKGKEMDNYFAPPWLFDRMFDFLVDYSNIVGNGTGQLSRPDEVLSSIIADVVTNSEPTLCRSINNKFLQGMIEQYLAEQDSVQILENMSNTDFDRLLAENIVFLSFNSSPSASNTVIECIVRNTPLIVNRFVALEEVLGTNYPGFYDSGNLFQAAAMIIDIKQIFLIHEYMKKIDKSQFHLGYFLEDFQNKLADVL